MFRDILSAVVTAVVVFLFVTLLIMVASIFLALI